MLNTISFPRELATNPKEEIFFEAILNQETDIEWEVDDVFLDVLAILYNKSKNLCFSPNDQMEERQFNSKGEQAICESQSMPDTAVVTNAKNRLTHNCEQ
ncbi:MAG: hypothetical protein HQM08_18855 [Candidatus Riflebacteria bacterium]|nr:hypothetical protein [Candidatus Riflebacteria bacterium]